MFLIQGCFDPDWDPLCEMHLGLILLLSRPGDELEIELEITTVFGAGFTSPETGL